MIYLGICFPLIDYNLSCFGSTGESSTAENIAWNNNLDVQAVMNQWKTSPGHNENILAPEVRINIHSYTI